MANNSEIIVFALSSSVNLAKEICSCLHIPLGKCDVKHFADGEIMVEPEESVRGKKVFLVQSTCNPVSDTLMEVLVALDALKRASAGEICCVIPYYGYARQDRKAAPRQPITSKLVADLLQVAGADRVITMDLHAPQIQGFFDVPIDDLTANYLLGQYIAHKHLQDITVVSPDHGGAVRARRLANYLGADTPIAIIDKRRTQPNVAEAMNLIGEVEGKNCVIIDDIVDTGGSLVGSVQMLKSKGAKDIYTVCTHGVLSRNAVDRIAESGIKEFIMTNSIELPPEKKRDNITVLSIGPLLAKVIEAIANHTPVSNVYDIFSNKD